MIPRILPVVLSTLALILAACGNATIGNPISAQNQPIDVKVTLTDFKIQSDLTNFQTGVSYRFIVTNSGAVAHEFVILPLGGQHTMSNMPGMPSSNMGGMSGDEGLVHISDSELPPGASKKVEVVFKNDTRGSLLEMACHVPGHYEAGMKLGIAVN